MACGWGTVGEHFGSGTTAGACSTDGGTLLGGTANTSPFFAGFILDATGGAASSDVEVFLRCE